MSSFGTYSVVVVNLDNGAITEYSGFSFHGAARIGDNVVLAGPGGVYLHSGTNDDGTDITWDITTWLSDFGTTTLKTMLGCYFGMRSESEIDVTAVGDKIKRSSNTIKGTKMLRMNRRAILSKGTKARYWGLELGSTGDFYLDSIEPVVKERRRRTGE